MAAILNFVGAFISLAGRGDVADGIVDADAITTTVVFAGSIGAIAWNLATWWFGLPSSSSHALIGGVVGAAFVAAGPARSNGEGLIDKVIVPGARRPGARVLRAGIAILIAYRIIGRLRPGPVARGYRSGSSCRAGCSRWRTARTTRRRRWASSPSRSSPTATSPATGFDVPTWVIVTSATAIALGTYMGGWRIIRTVGSRIIKMDSAQGFSAQGAGAAVVLAATHLGFPLSTTHVISGGVMGAGAAKRLSAVRWGVAGNIAVAWVPHAAVLGGDRRPRLRRHADLRDGRARPGGRRAVRRRAHRGRVRPPLAGAPPDADGRGMIASVAVQDLLELAGVSLAATIGLSLAAAVCVLGVTRATELRRGGNAVAAGGYAALALAGVLIVAAGCVFAIVVIVNG